MAIFIPWRTGVNMREFAYYDPQFMKGIPSGLQTVQLKQLQAMGVKVIRFFACHKSLSPADTIARVKVALNNIDQHGMQAIVCLSDSLNSGFSVPEDAEFPEKFHDQVHGHLNKDYWHTRHYQNTYLKHIAPIVEAFKDHRAVLMWELGNEYAIHPQPAEPRDSEAFLAFVEEASALIKKIAPNSLVTTGLVNSNHISAPGEREKTARRLYKLDTVDVISIHFYQHDGEKNNIEPDVKIAKELQKPFFIGEMGAIHIERDKNGKIIKTNDRTEFYRDEINAWKRDGAFTVLPWSFDASDHDVGVSDTMALARIHSDFDSLVGILQSVRADVERFIITGKEKESSGSSTDFEAQGFQTSAKPILFRVIDGPLQVREEAGLSAKKTGLQFGTGEVLIVDADSSREVDGYIWWHHADGWSAEGKVDGSEPLMTRIIQPDRTLTLPDGKTIDIPVLFERLPVAFDQIKWMQYFGNTTFAFDLESNPNHDTRHMYDYSQGLHGGLDLGNPAPGILVCPGVSGKAFTHPDSRFYKPNYVHVKVKGFSGFTIIYGHLGVPQIANEIEVGPDDPIAAIEPGKNGHLHLEIRWQDTWIINPLLFMSDDMRNQLIKAHKPSFFSAPAWKDWQTPLDQPVIKLSNPKTAVIIGPRAAMQVPE